MDPALIKQRQEFMKQAIRSQNIMQQMRKDGPQSQAQQQQQHTQLPIPHKKKKKVAPTANNLESSLKSEGQNAANFSIMAKIVDYMKKRHLNQQQWPLSLREVLDEMQAYDVNKKTIFWLQEALPQNPRLQTESDGKFSFKPPYPVKNKATLLALLKKYHAGGKGGILNSELSECIPNAEAMAKSLGPQIIAILTQRKDIVYFYNDSETDYNIEKEFVELWRAAGVEHLDENKIEEYLQKHGLETARDLAPKKTMAAGAAAPKRKRVKPKVQKVHNVHLEGVLEDYASD